MDHSLTEKRQLIENNEDTKARRRISLMVNGHGFGLTCRVSQDRTVSISISLVVPLLLRVFVVQLRFLGLRINSKMR